MCGNGFCGYSSMSLCLTGSEANYELVIEDCLKVFTNSPQLLLERTNFGASNSSKDAASKYYWHMQAAIRRVRSGDLLTNACDEMFWMEDVHIIAISLLYDIAIFRYSTIARKWFAFNENARNGYVCLLSSANHTDILLGTCDSTGRRLPPTVPVIRVTSSVSRLIRLNRSSGSFHLLSA